MNQFVAALQRFGIGRLAAILGIGAGVAAALIALTMNLGQPKALLYSSLDMREAGSITAALDQAGVKYEVKGDGSTIMVNRDEVASTRLLLSAKGLPTAGSVGYEIFDDSNALGQTDFVQQLNRQRALEGELARTIRSLDGVTFARVHLVLPKRQLFEEAAEEPSASITMGVGGRAPNPDQVRAVQNLVAGAVPRMTPDRVTIVDQHGKTLSAGGEGFAGEAAEGRKNEVEQRIAKTVKALVESVVGPGKARVNVTAELDLARVTVQQETYDPDGQVVRSEQTVEENANENEPNNNGAVTADANIPGGIGGGAAGALASASGRTESTTNYEISKTVRTEVNEPGKIQRLSVAVAVDGVRPVGEDGAPGEYAARSEEEMARIEQLVRTAVGFNEERGDQVTVVNMPFDAPAAMGGVESSNPLADFDKNDIMRAVELAILAIVALLIVFFVVRPLLKSASGGGGELTGQTQTITRLVTTTADGQPVQIAIDPATGQPLALPGPDALEQKIDIARIEGQVKASSVKRVADFVETHPEQSVAILRSWLHESA
ncbi:MAG: flagellar basal-body MS-ring/collar protein FliF [Phenylobacterium sp.]|uniref:flagellar basal-body MS-ring/collar protein FliF n=1 Tax=Phenylobacterium sp. TaxID=1871053 RepID=UPI0027329B16|nr:flagellar basal-body MS-ring/collar protein FliF [Phenylobacterium sp.]MDP1640788.1 flagellar basal-body MS-ring/collar protein FliF [Phenylobacterium sp.]MDP3116519.1 flagellar basal-body MS-ring/collar protein FliF [Phenylobacterium sp.]MDZ4053899.1 flagellar basal-body MS-ring/collar protein FliF [Phenylobacterium sp.]